MSRPKAISLILLGLGKFVTSDWDVGTLYECGGTGRVVVLGVAQYANYAEMSKIGEAMRDESS